MPVFSPPSLLSFGEVLWDVFPFGEHIGGAAFNLAAHASHCGLRSFLYSRVGADSRGDLAREAVHRHGVASRFLQVDPARETGWVSVELTDGQPSYRIMHGVAWDAIEAPTGEVLSDLRGRDFSALACGTLAQRGEPSRAALAAIRRALPGVPVFYDVNLRGAETPIETVRATLPGVRWLKVNEEEAGLISRDIFRRELGTLQLAAALASDFGVETLLITRGARGCEIIAGGELVTIGAHPVEVVSAVGAGDAFSAAFLAALLQRQPTDEAARHASALAQYVVTRAEAIPDYPPELQERFHFLLTPTHS